MKNTTDVEEEDRTQNELRRSRSVEEKKIITRFERSPLFLFISVTFFVFNKKKVIIMVTKARRSRTRTIVILFLFSFSFLTLGNNINNQYQ